MKNRLYIYVSLSVVLLFVFILSMVLYIQLFPDDWAKVKKGMAYSEVCSKIGAIDHLSPDSPFFSSLLEKNLIIIRHSEKFSECVMIVYFEPINDANKISREDAERLKVIDISIRRNLFGISLCKK
jgi:hypothetical protein